MTTKTLLVLDDDAATTETIITEAQALGFEVRAFAEPQLFLSAFQTWAPTHLAIDLMIPGMDGIQLMQDLAGLRCASAIILTSGIGSVVLPATQLIAIEHNLNVRGIVHSPFNPLLFNSLLSDQVSEDLHTYANGMLAKPAYTADEAALSLAIEQDQFCLYYQPQIDLPSGKVIGFEGLLRWRHPELGIKLPDSFIPLAERTGQIDQLTDIVIAKGFEFISKLDPKLSFSLNISAKSIKDDSLLTILDNACQAYTVSPHRIVLELTETATMIDPVRAEHILTQLRSKGFRISIDDFGTGYSSMAQLAKLPFTELKIDKSFVTTMEFSSKSRKVVASTIKLAESLGLSTVAEGIENSIAAIGLRELGCQFGQGYYFARPMNDESALTWLQTWSHQFG